MVGEARGGVARRERCVGMASDVGASSSPKLPVRNGPGEDEESNMVARPSEIKPPASSSEGVGVKAPASFAKAAEYLARAFGGGSPGVRANSRAPPPPPERSASPPEENVAGDGAEILDAAELLFHLQSSKVTESLQGASVGGKARGTGGASAKGGNGGKAHAGWEGAHSAKGDQGVKGGAAGRMGVKSAQKRAAPVAGIAAPRMGVKSPEKPVEGKRPKVLSLSPSFSLSLSLSLSLSKSEA